jgi:hypothetical protein
VEWPQRIGVADVRTHTGPGPSRNPASEILVGLYVGSTVLGTRPNMKMFNSFKRLLKPDLIWSIAVFAEAPEWSLGEPLGKPAYLLDSKIGDRTRPRVRAWADPFLFVHDGAVYLLLEALRVGGVGAIEAYRSTDLTHWESLGEILREPWHLSFPCIFEEAGAVYMIPESRRAGRMTLYRFEAFPREPVPIRCLLRGEFVDTCPLKVDSCWYLFTTSRRGLEIYFTDDLIEGELRAHPANPISTDARYARSGGAPVRENGRLVRFAQDGSVRYGGNLNLMEIVELSSDLYSERVLLEGMFDLDRSWNRLGGHHMSLAEFKGRRLIAVDGLQRDSYARRFSSLFKTGSSGSARTGLGPASRVGRSGT